MCQFVGLFFVAGLAIALLAVVIAGELSSVFLARLERSHPVEWAAHGKPKASDDPIVISGMDITAYFSEKRYESLQDPAIIFLGNWARRFQGVAIRLGIGLILLFAAYHFGLKRYFDLACWL